MPNSAGLPKFFTRLGTPFHGSFALSRVNVGSKTPFEHFVFINNPAVAHGQAVLGRAGRVDAAPRHRVPSDSRNEGSKRVGRRGEPRSIRAALVVGGVDAALLRALPSGDVRTRVPYRSCAVVGSSGAVLSYENGASIDLHAMVLRFNDAPTKGFELYVGGKTTHRVCTGWGLTDIARHVIQRIFNPRFSISMPCYDAASTICQAPARGSPATRPAWGSAGSGCRRGRRS